MSAAATTMEDFIYCFWSARSLTVDMSGPRRPQAGVGPLDGRVRHRPRDETPSEASRTDTQLASHHELALHGIAFQQLVGLLDHFRGQPPENSYRRWWKRTADEMPRQLLQYFSVLSPGGAILGQRVGVGAY